MKRYDEEIVESEDIIMMWGYGYGFNWLSMMMMVIGMVLLIGLVWSLVSWLNNRTPSSIQQTQTRPENGPTALEILRQRYARGEIDATTFEQMREKFEASDNSHQQSRAEVS